MAKLCINVDIYDMENIVAKENSVEKDNKTTDDQLQVEKHNNLSFLSILRKTKKKKRHFNINKNKKWNKTFKRQKTGNVTIHENQTLPQSSRNKHVYTKIPKITFSNKLVMHRGTGLSKFFLPDKQPRDIIVPPTKFLLGGNISDPLNLNSLQDEALVSMSAVTPKSSPITTPPKVEVIIPPNIFDPLHLLDPVDSIEYEKQLVSPLKTRRLNKPRCKKKKLKKCDVSADTTENHDSTIEALRLKIIDSNKDVVESHPQEYSDYSTNLEEKSTNLDYEDTNSNSNIGRKRKISESGCSTQHNTHFHGGGSGNKKIRRFDSKDKIVSPVIPQPGAWKRLPKVQLGAPRNRIRTTSTSDDNNEETNRKIDWNEEIKPDPACSTNSDISPKQEQGTDISLIDETYDDICNKITFNQDSMKYQFGNFAREYCGLQTLFDFSDVRLTIFLRHAYLFKDKDVLDIGCNVGHMTIAVGRKLHPKSIMGIDIDKNLVSRARQNLSHFFRILPNQYSNVISKTDVNNPNRPKFMTRSRDNERQGIAHFEYFPMSMPICLGSIPIENQKAESPWSSPASSMCAKITDSITNSKHNLHKESSPMHQHIRKERQISSKLHIFPENVYFRTVNYAVSDESQMNCDRQQYDLILCLSVTKWIHLNCGDSGLKMTFRRMFNQLRPGGKLILEAQNWASYKNRKKITPNIYHNYKNIEFFPDSFHEYLLSPEVGFSHSYTLGVPRHTSKGFYRPIQLYIKGDFTPSQVRWSDTYHPQTPHEPIRYTHYVDPKRIALSKRSNWNMNKIHNMYRNREPPLTCGRMNTPTYGIPSTTSRYYNPLETDSYLPSYDNVVQTRHYCFASPLYSTVWSPPASGRKSASQTPLFGSIRRVDSDDQESSMKHVYLTSGAFDSCSSSRSNDESSSLSPKPQHVYAIGSSRSIRDIESDPNPSSPKEHVYAFQ